VDWIHLAQDMDQWRALVNTITKFGFRKRRRVSYKLKSGKMRDSKSKKTHLLQ